MHWVARAAAAIVITFLAVGGAAAQTDAFARFDAGFHDAGDFKFRILAGADLPGNDIRSGLSDRRLSGISGEDCLALCVADRMCAAFTYNQDASVCFLKSASGMPEAFAGAVSGIKYMGGSTEVTTADVERENALSKNQKIAIQAQLNALGHKLGTADGAFGPATRRAIRSFQSTFRSPQTGYLTAEQLRMIEQKEVYAEKLVELEGRDQVRVARAGTLSPDQCEAVETETRRIAKGAQLKLDTASAKVGEAVAISYDLPHPANRMALYLMVAFDKPVRFAGDGFYGLTPGARAAFDIAYRRETTRAVVPLYMSDTSYQGAINFIPLELGDTAVDAALVVMTGCGEHILDLLPQTKRIAVAPGAPEFVILDEYSTGAAGKRYRSPAGGRLIEEFDAGFRILDEETGIQIAERVGKEPRFSPTGRFVAAFVDDMLSIYDAIDGNEIRSVRATHVAWDDRDSFVVIGGGGRGLIWTYPALGGNAGTTTDPACRTCAGVHESTYQMDLENNVVLATGGLGEVGASITTPASYDNAWGNGSDKLKYGSLEGFVDQVSGLTPIEMSKRWRMIDQLQFTHLDVGFRPTDYRPDPNLLQFVVSPIPAETDGGEQQIASTAMRPAARAMRGAMSLASAPPPSGDTLLQRLAEEFGLQLAAGTPFVRDPEPTIVAGKSPTSDYGNLLRLKIDDRILYDTGAMCMTGPPEIAGSEILCSHYTAVWTAQTAKGAVSLIGGGDTGGSAGYSATLVAMHDSSAPGRLAPIGVIMPYEEVQNPGGGCGGDCDFHASLVADRYVVVWSTSHQRIEVFDRQTQSTRGYKTYRGDLMNDIYMSADLRSLLQVNSDGTFAIHTVDQGVQLGKGDWDYNFANSDSSIVLYGRFADDEIVIWSADGRYDATYEGAYQVFLRFPGTLDLFTFDQFEPLLNEPGLLRHTLHDGETGKAIAYQVPPIIDAEIEASGDIVSIQLAHRGGNAVDMVSVFQDGKATDRLSATEDGATMRLAVKRRPGTRWLTLVASDANGLSSTPIGRDLGKPDRQARMLNVVSVGIDTYSDDALPDLAYAASDAKRFAEALSTNESGLFAQVNTDVFDSSAATRDSILDALDSAISGADAGTDTAIFYAGHGLQDADGSYYLALPSTDPKRLAETGLAWSDVERRIGAARGRVVVFLDSCHSGEAGRDLFTTNDDAVASVLDRAQNGVVVFAASKGREQAIESGQDGGGLFTSAVAAVIGPERASYDRNKNGVLEASELYRGIKTRVWQASSGHQTPWMARNRMIGDFALF